MSKAQYPEPVTGAFIFNRENQILLAKSWKWPGDIWSVAGGHIEYGEKIEDAVEREVMEELGLVVKFQRVITVLESIFSPNFVKKKHFIFNECECLLVGEFRPRYNAEIQETRWFSLTDALSLKNLHPAVRTTIEIVDKEQNAK